MLPNPSSLTVLQLKALLSENNLSSTGRKHILLQRYLNHLTSTQPLSLTATAPVSPPRPLTSTPLETTSSAPPPLTSTPLETTSSPPIPLTSPSLETSSSPPLETTSSPTREVTTPGSLNPPPLTPDQLNRIALKRAEALEKLAQKQRERHQNEQVSRRETSTAQPTSTTGSACAQQTRPRNPERRKHTFAEYDFDKTKDTRGGFLAEEDGNGFKRKKFEMPKPIEDPAMSINPEENPTCKLCNTFDIDHDIRRHYNVPVCRTCCEAHPERFSLITKTEARTDYMLTDPELNDKDLLPRWEKPNPRKTHWSNMFLYLREQVEEYAFKKWGGEDAMDAEFERREAVAKDRKDKKFKKELSDLRRRTRTSTWQKDKHTRHVHSYGPSMPNGDEGSSVQKCVECGMEIECEEF